MKLGAHRLPGRLVAVIAVLGGALLFGAVALGAGEAGSALPGANLVRVLVGTLVAVGLLLLTARFLPRLGGARGVASHAFRVVASLPVGQRERVVVVQVGDEQVMLGVAPGRVDMIRELSAPLEERQPADGGAGMPPAQAWLSRVLGKSS